MSAIIFICDMLVLLYDPAKLNVSQALEILKKVTYILTSVITKL